MVIKPRIYETLYLVRPDMGTEEFDAIQKKLTKVILASEGEIHKNEKWEERNLAYPINKYKKGTYHILIYKAAPVVVPELEKLFNLNKSDVLRFMTTLFEEEEVKPQVKEQKSQSGTDDENISVFQSAASVQSEPAEPASPDENTETGGND